MQRQVIVIGAGAAGLMAAITAAREGCKVTVLEHTSKIGRKIEITGNGKCNYTNARQDMEFYHSPQPDYVEQILGCFTYEQTVAFFEELGIVPKCRNGYYYPYSGQAQAIAAALRMEAERLHIKLACNIDIESIEPMQGSCEGFVIHTKGYMYQADAVIIAAGSKAAPATGSDGSGYDLAKSLGHKVRKPLPALVQLLSRNKNIPLLAGLRCEGSVSLHIDGVLRRQERGELQFVKNGLSGIPVLQLSGEAVRALDQGKDVELCVNFLSEMGWKDIEEKLERRKELFLSRPIYAFLNGMVHDRAAKAVLAQVGIKGGREVRELHEAQWESMVRALRDMRFQIHSSNGFEQAQVCSGGVSFSQLREGTLESAICPNLYFAGEILDVDGACGGYNLQWAWASGYAAGKQAAKG